MRTTPPRRMAPGRRGLRPGLARIARHRRRRRTTTTACPCIIADVGPDADAPDRRPPRPRRRRPGLRGAVRAARRGRPADRPRRLRHEGRARGDDVRDCRRRRRRTGVRVRFVCVPDEESEDVDDRSTDALVAGGLTGDFAITGEPTDLHIGVQAKGVLAMRIEVSRHRRARLDAVAGRQRDPQGPRRLPPHRDAAVQPRVLRPLRPPLDQPRPDRRAATRSTRCPTAARSTSTSATCPTRSPARSSRQIRAIGDLEVAQELHPRAGDRLAPQPLRAARCATRCRRSIEGEALSVGRDGASDAVSFLEAGVPAVEFGPVGGGHHGPEEWVSIASLRRLPPGARRLRRARCPAWLERERGDERLRAIEGGLA